MAKLRRIVISAAAVCLMSCIPWAQGAEHVCQHCGCRQVKKVTRLTKTCAPLQIPSYECLPTAAYFPAKGIVAHNKNRCEANFEIATCGKLCERCVEHQEPCEVVTHIVQFGDTACSRECHTSEHHGHYYDYQVQFSNKVVLTSNPTQCCQQLYGACPQGCHKVVSMKTPKPVACQTLAPEVRWVTFHVCTQCSHSWPAGQADAAATSD